MNARDAAYCEATVSLARPARSGAAVLEWVTLSMLAVGWAYFSYGYIEDDAFIHLEFARSVADGLGFAFAGNVTNGDTSPLWVLFLILVHAFGIPWIPAAKVACAAGLVLAASGAWKLASDLPHECPTHQRLPFAAFAVIVLSPYFVHWSFSGMEGTAALGLSLWALWAIFLGRLTVPRALFAASLLALGPLLRPELLVFAALVGPVLLWRLWQANEGKSAAYRLACCGGLGLLMLVPSCAWCYYALHAFGSLIPNTNAAKRGGALSGIAWRLVQVYAMGFSVTLLGLPFALIRGMWGRRTPGVIWALLLWPAACVVFYLADHTLVQTRYCLLSMPSASIAVLWLLARILRPRAFAVAAGAMLATSLLVIASIVVPHVRNKSELRESFAAVSAFIRENIPARERVAVFAIGQIEFESQHPLVDLGGITEPEVVPYLNDPRAVLRWAKGRGARYFVGNDPPEPGALPVFAVKVPYIGWSLRHARYSAREPYGVYRLPK
jgi:hypothetical protein